MSAFTLRCPSCRCDCLDGNVRHEDYLTISECCDEVVEKVWWCETCGARECHSGTDECLRCLADSFVAAPAAFIGTEKLKAEIAGELARRPQPGFLLRRQAGGGR